MNTLVLNLMPGLMMRYEYVHRLLEWLKEASGEIEKHPSTTGYSLIGSALLSSLEKAARDVHSVPLLQLVAVVQKNHDDRKIPEGNEARSFRFD